MIRETIMVGLALSALQLVATMRNTDPDIRKTIQSIEPISEKINKFSFDFVKEFENGTRNEMLSPLSVWTAMSILLLGSRGITRNELMRGLYLDDPLDVSLLKIERFIHDLNMPSTKGPELNLANGIFMKKQLIIEERFRMQLRSYHNASVQFVDFPNSAETSKTINIWVEQQTHSRIKDIISPHSIDGRTAMVLVNTLYFKGTWSSVFDKSSTEPGDFHLLDKTTKKVPMMTVIDHFKYGEIPDEHVSFIELPFKSQNKNQSISMFVVIPNEVVNFENAKRNIKKIWMNLKSSGSHYRRCSLFLPKFKIESTINLESSLQNLEMRNIFDDSADFSGITTSPPRARVSNVLQKVFIEVNENGVEATAATAIRMEFMSLPTKDPPTIKVDKPFFFIIATKKVILFVGKVFDPSQGGSIASVSD